jgi:hypothetical protein
VALPINRMISIAGTTGPLGLFAAEAAITPR